MNKIQSEDKVEYLNKPVGMTHSFLSEQEIIDDALRILEKRMKNRMPSEYISCPQDSISYLKLKTASLEHEAFTVMFLNNRHGIIEIEQMFTGTIDSSSVYPREVMKMALKYNSAAVILSHNHPSGIAEPSQSDIAITKRLKDALAFVDVRVLDHIIIGGTTHYSLAERGDM